MRILLWLLLGVMIAGCSGPLSGQKLGPAAALSTPRPEEIRKLGPELRRHLLQEGRRALETPQLLGREMPPVAVVIQAHRDISKELEDHGATVRSVVHDGVVVITADVPPAAIPDLLRLPALKAIELTQPVPPAREGEDVR